MRAFIAVEISEEQRKKLTEFQSALEKCGADLKIVEPENLHMTLRFLGEISEQELEKAKKGLQFAVSGLQSFSLSIKGAGVFPNLNYIRVVWAGVEKGKEELSSIAEKINSEIKVGEKDALRSASSVSRFARDERGFSAHITVARAKTAKSKEKIAEILKEYLNFDFGETTVSEIKIKESKLSPKGPVYSDLFSVKLS